MSDLLAAIGVTTSFDGDGSHHDDQSAATSRRSPRTSSSSGSGRRSTCSVRCSVAAASHACRCPAATTSAAGRSTCTSRVSRRWARRSRLQHGYVEADCRPPARCRHHARVPQRRRDREHPHRGGARQGHDGDRQRGARAGDRRPVRDADGDGRRDRGRRLVDAGGARRRARLAARRRPRASSPTASRPPPTSPPWPCAGGEVVLRGARPGPHGDAAAPLRRHGCHRHRRRRRAGGVGPTSGCARSTWRRCRTPASPPTTSR